MAGVHIHACTYLLLACSLTYLWRNINTVDIINKYKFSSENGANGFIKVMKLLKKSGVVLTASYTTG
jgi:hypothetical protein